MNILVKAWSVQITTWSSQAGPRYLRSTRKTTIRMQPHFLSLCLRLDAYGSVIDHTGLLTCFWPAETISRGMISC